MIASRSVSSMALNTWSASATGRSTYSCIERPFTRTARLSAFNRAPPHAGHGRSDR